MKDTKKVLPNPNVVHYYHNRPSPDIRFVRFENAYRNEKDDYTTLRIHLSTVVHYKAFDHIKFDESSYYSKEMKIDLGKTAYCINVLVAQGEYKGEHRIYFWTRRQRDETLGQLDTIVGTYEMTPKPSISVINPSYERIPEGGATIQELPNLD